MKKRGGITLLELFLLLALIALAVYWLGPNFVRPHQGPGDRHLGCKLNLKNIATALEMYASDNQGRYPTGLDQLIQPPTPYLKQIPTCPAAGRSTYGDYQMTYTPDVYTLSCVGDHHQAFYRAMNVSGDVQNYPGYSSVKGLMLPPPLEEHP